MSASPGNYCSSSQSSWESNDIIHHRSYSESLGASPLNMVPSPVNYGVCRNEREYFKITKIKILTTYLLTQSGDFSSPGHEDSSRDPF